MYHLLCRNATSHCPPGEAWGIGRSRLPQVSQQNFNVKKMESKRTLSTLVVRPQCIHLWPPNFVLSVRLWSHVAKECFQTCLLEDQGSNGTELWQSANTILKWSMTRTCSFLVKRQRQRSFQNAFSTMSPRGVAQPCYKGYLRGAFVAGAKSHVAGASGLKLSAAGHSCGCNPSDFFAFVRTSLHVASQTDLALLSLQTFSTIHVSSVTDAMIYTRSCSDIVLYHIVNTDMFIARVSYVHILILNPFDRSFRLFRIYIYIYTQQNIHDFYILHIHMTSCAYRHMYMYIYAIFLELPPPGSGYGTTNKNHWLLPPPARPARLA